MAYDFAVIRERVARDPEGFVAQCNETYQKRIEKAAQAVIANLPHSPIVLLSGPSGSGKTTTALKLEQELERQGVGTYTISMDDYFMTLNRATAPRTPEGDIDYESPLMMDMELLDRHFVQLSKGEEIVVPKFEFARQMRNDSRGTPLRLGKNEVAIVEGIHALNDDIAGRHPEATGIYISARSSIELEGKTVYKGTWTRITRRAVRDHNFRGTGMAETLSMWHNVRRGEKKYISPFKNRAKVVIDSSFPYEIPVFAAYAQPIRDAVAQVSPANARYQELGELAEALTSFPVLDPQYVPKDALIREFIGGGVYQY